MVGSSASALIMAHDAVWATSAEHLVSEHEHEAKAIHYVHDSASISKDEFDFYTEGSECGNCRFYKPQAGGHTGNCSMYFPKRLVKAKGWCVGWMLKSS